MAQWLGVACGTKSPAFYGWFMTQVLRSVHAVFNTAGIALAHPDVNETAHAQAGRRTASPYSVAWLVRARWVLSDGASKSVQSRN